LQARLKLLTDSWLVVDDIGYVPDQSDGRDAVLSADDAPV
jgi:hypothetical protein